MDATHARAEHAEAQSNLAVLWFGVAAGPLLWSAHLLVCYAWYTNGHSMGNVGLRVGLYIFTLVMAAIVFAAGAGAVLTWRRIGEPLKDTWEPSTRPAFMALCGIIFSTFFFFAILLEGIPIIMIQAGA